MPVSLLDRYPAEREPQTPITLIQRFGSAANLNTHLHAQVLDGVYHSTDSTGDGAPMFHPASASSHEQLQTLFDKVIRRCVKLLICLGVHSHSMCATFNGTG